MVYRLKHWLKWPLAGRISMIERNIFCRKTRMERNFWTFINSLLFTMGAIMATLGVIDESPALMMIAAGCWILLIVEK